MKKGKKMAMGKEKKERKKKNSSWKKEKKKEGKEKKRKKKKRWGRNKMNDLETSTYIQRRVLNYELPKLPL